MSDQIELTLVGVMIVIVFGNLWWKHRQYWKAKHPEWNWRF